MTLELYVTGAIVVLLCTIVFGVIYLARATNNTADLATGAVTFILVGAFLAIVWPAAIVIGLCVVALIGATMLLKKMGA